MSSLNPKQTSDTPFAAFLMYHDHKLVDTMQDKADRRRVVYVFIEQDNTQELEDEFYADVAKVNPQIYYKFLKRAFRELRNR